MGAFTSTHRGDSFEIKKVFQISEDTAKIGQGKFLKFKKHRKSRWRREDFRPKTGDKISSKPSKSYLRLQWRIPGGKGRILKDFFTIEQSVICFPNCVQIWKGRDWKTVFCIVRHKKCQAKGETLMSNLAKSCFPNLSFSNYFSWW